ncbi:hypothetical protein Tco_0837068 [Tanacetum coccineum]
MYSLPPPSTVSTKDIRPIYNEETMAEVQLTTECNVFATGQQRAEQPEFNNEGEVDQNAQQYHDKCPLHTKFTDNQTTELSNQSLESENIFTTHYFPKEREAASTKPHHIIASSNSRNSSKNMPRFSLNDMVHNHYLEEAKNKTHDIELGIHDHSNELSSSKLVPKVVPPADKTATSRQESYALSWKPCQGDSLNLPDHRIHKDGDGDALFQLKSDSLPHAHAQTTKTYNKHRDS